MTKKSNIIRTMPPLSHWPDREQPFDKAQSHVVQWIASMLDTTIDTAENIRHNAAAEKQIVFDPITKLWQGIPRGTHQGTTKSQRKYLKKKTQTTV